MIIIPLLLLIINNNNNTNNINITMTPILITMILIACDGLPSLMEKDGGGGGAMEGRPPVV